MWLRLTTAAALAVATLTTGGCSGGSDCSTVGAFSGVVLDLPPTVTGDGLEAEVRLCQDDRCQTATGPVRRPGADGSVGASVTFDDFASSYDDGPADLAVVVRDGSRTVRTFESEAELTSRFPNGRGCDGDGFLQGEADLRNG